MEWHDQQPIRLMCPPLRIATSPPYGHPMMWDVPFSDVDILAAWAAGWDPVWVLSLYIRMTGRCGQSSAAASWQGVWTSTSSSSSCGVHMRPDPTLRLCHEPGRAYTSNFPHRASPELRSILSLSVCAALNYVQALCFPCGLSMSRYVPFPHKHSSVLMGVTQGRFLDGARFLTAFLRRYVNTT